MAIQRRISDGRTTLSARHTLTNTFRRKAELGTARTLRPAEGAQKSRRAKRVPVRCRLFQSFGARSAAPATALLNNPEVKTQVQETVQKQTNSWITRKIPALRGRTPHKPSKTPTERKSSNPSPWIGNATLLALAISPASPRTSAPSANSSISPLPNPRPDRSPPDSCSVSRAKQKSP